jgi:hypothetical protein
MLAFFSTLLVLIIAWNVNLHDNELVLGSMSLMLIFLYRQNPFPLRSNYIFTGLIVTFLFLFYLMYSIKATNTELASFMIQAFTNIYLFFFISIFYDKQKGLLFKSVYYTLIIFIVTWYVQFFIYYTTGYYIDYLEPVTGEAQRYQAYFVAGGIDLIRPTSIFNEPGTYAMAALPYMILSYLEYRQMRTVHYFALASFFLSLSLFAIMTASLFIVVAMLHKIKVSSHEKRLKMIPIFLVTLLSLAFILQSYNSFRFNSAENLRQVGLRTNIIAEFVSSSDTTMTFGHGFEINDKASIATDTSSWFRMVYDYGVLSIPLFVLFLYISWGLPAFFTIILLLTKINYFTYIFWFFFASLMVLHKNNPYMLLHKPTKNKDANHD